MKFDHKLSPVERGTAIQDLCGKNLNDIINIFSAHGGFLVHDAHALIFSVFKKYGLEYTDPETECYISDHIEDALKKMAQKSTNNKNGFTGGLSKKFLETSAFFAILAEAVHKIELASI